MPKESINFEFEAVLEQGRDLIQNSRSIKRSYSDELYQLASSQPIKIITGFRRSGKSTLVKELCRNLVAKKRYSINNILYLNFEDLSLEKYLEAKKIKELIDYFTKKIPKKRLLVLDEVQLVKNWDKLLRTIYEFDAEANIVITGSNSELLSSELSSKLAGRFVELSIQTFSLKEFLDFKNYNISNKKEFDKYHYAIKDLFYEYIRFGGFPEVFSITSEDAKKTYLKNLISKVILDDVIKRFSIRNPIIIEKILVYLLLNIGNVVSFTRIENHLKQLGYKVKANTIINYVEYLTKTFALTEVNRFSWKSQRVFETTRKYYAADPGLSYVYYDLGNNFTKRLENIVYNQLKREKNAPSIYYGYDDMEVDFICHEERTGQYEKFQVTKELTEENQEREFNSLIYSDGYTKKSRNYLLSLEDDNKIEQAQLPGLTVKIEQQNLLKWLLAIE